MFDTVTVIGAGRAGSAIAARLRERGIDVRDGRRAAAPLRAGRARSPRSRGRSSPGRGSRTSRARTPLAALDPHARRFSVHPLQTLVRSRGPEQLDGAWGAVTARDGRGPRTGALARRRRSACAVRRSPTATGRSTTRAPSIASNFLVTLYRAAAGLVDDAGAPPEALVPLMRRTIENGFELTGPIARGDWETVDRHREALRGSEPQLEPLYARARGGDGRS